MTAATVVRSQPWCHLVEGQLVEVTGSPWRGGGQLVVYIATATGRREIVPIDALDSVSHARLIFEFESQF